MEGTPYQNCHARPGRTADDQKERDDQADGNADLDTPDNCEEECKTHERHINPCAHPAVSILGDHKLFACAAISSLPVEYHILRRFSE
jgi:hypothetical protein